MTLSKSKVKNSNVCKEYKLFSQDDVCNQMNEKRAEISDSSSILHNLNNYVNIFYSIIQDAHRGIIIINKDSLVSYINTKFCQLMNLKIVDVINKDFRIVFEPNISSFFSDRLSELKNGNSILLNSSLEFVRGDNTKIYLEITAKRIKDTNNDSLLVIQLLDVTEKKIFETELISAKEEAEKANKLKSEFLAQISHEIRTPISTLLSFASLVRSELENVISDDLNKGFDIMERAGQRIIRTTDLILNMSEIQLGTYEPHIKELDICKDVLNNLFDEFASIAEEKEIKFRVNRKTDNCKILADEYTVTQIIRNLLDNAFKYTYSGTVDVNIYNGNPNQISFEVCDTGIGISEKYLPIIFNTFSQEEQGYTRKYDGNGLGLALVKKYCDLNNAKIEVESKKNLGSKFKVIFVTQHMGK